MNATSAEHVFLVLKRQEEEPEKYQSHFASYVEAGVEPDDIEDLYKEVTV